jgi:hypothetical protein
MATDGCACSACFRGEPSQCEKARWLERLTEQGYLVLAPGDSSPPAELIREAVEWGISEAGVLDAAAAVAQDPACRAWSARGR